MERLDEERYLIGEKIFVLRDDLSDNELTAFEKFAEPWKAIDKKTISSSKNYTRKEVLENVKMILTPIDGSDKEKFDFGVLTEIDMVIIIADFAKKKAQEKIILEASLENFKKKLPTPLTNLKA